MRTRVIVSRALLIAAVAAGASGAAAHAAGAAYYVAPNGSDGAAGTLSAPWASIAHAQTVAGAGDTVYVRGGTYSYSHGTTGCASQTATVDAITLNKSGSSGSPISYAAYPGEKPVFTFSGMTDNCRIKGFDVTGSWIHLKGLEVTGVRQNNNLNHESWGIWISGSNNTFEQLNTHHNMGPGLFIQNGGGNLVLNSDSHDNHDPLSSDGAGENADGFGAHIPANHPGNVFRGDRAWWNSDDGFDLINAYSSVTIENSWAWRNDYVDNTGYNNHPDFNMLGVTSGGAATGLGTLRNDIAYAGTLTSNMTGTSDAYNSWNVGVTLSDAQFRSVSTTGWDAARQSDGGLPALSQLHLAANSTLIDKGVDVGLPYHGRAPDLGAFET
jgi:hypothetical protein